MPVDRMAITSEFAAMIEVKKMTEMNTNSGLNMFMKYGIQFR